MGTGMKILIAEDEPDIARSYKLTLEERGHSVLLASDGVDCLAKYQDEWLKIRNTQDLDRFGIEMPFEIERSSIPCNHP